LLLEDGFLVHACGLAIDNHGVLAIGRSGSGKSTLARMFPPDSVLSDELVALRMLDGKPTLCSTPFAGEVLDVRRQRTADLCLGLLLSKDLRTGLDPADPTEAARQLFACVAVPRGGAALEPRAFPRVLDLAKGTAWSTLHFSPQSRAVRAAVAGGCANR
jgi:alpha-D-ribose 1-methylphosphonate 5-triphosphate synthase subunit PhnL